MRCLIVDDNASFLADARALLERQGLCIVGVAAHGAEALDRVAELSPDVILLDVNLGGESGFCVARKLLAVPHPGLPRVILISAHPKDEFVEMVEQSPAAGFIAKPELSRRR